MDERNEKTAQSQNQNQGQNRSINENQQIQNKNKSSTQMSRDNLDILGIQVEATTLNPKSEN